jgi:hypothetical protein
MESSSQGLEADLQADSPRASKVALTNTVLQQRLHRPAPTPLIVPTVDPRPLQVKDPPGLKAWEGMIRGIIFSGA